MSKNPDAVEAGALAQHVGSNFETWVEGQHEMAKYLGILAHVVHNEPKTRFIRGRLEHAAKSVADYTGVLCGAGARTLASETKSTSDERFPKNEVTAEQQTHLDAVASEGGLSILLVEFRVGVVRHRFAMDWKKAPWRVKRSAEALYLDELLTTDWQVREPCYLSRWHAGGPRKAAAVIQRRYPTE